MLEGNGRQRECKIITIPDDNLVNPWRSAYLKLKSGDYRVAIPDDNTHAVIWIEDDERVYNICSEAQAIIISLLGYALSKYYFIAAFQPLAYVHLEDSHFSVVEGGAFEVCVVAENHSPEELTFDVWIHIKGKGYENVVLNFTSSFL